MNFLKGRINRSTYWLGVLLILALVFAARTFFGTDMTVNEAIVACFCIPRLHDLGRSGWWVILGIGAEIAAMIYAFSGPPEQVEITLTVAMAVLALALIVLGSVPGQSTANRFGPPPKPWLKGQDQPR